MKQSQRRKVLLRHHPVVRITYEKDYDDPAWLEEGPAPTLATHPDAFYRCVEEVLTESNARAQRKEKAQVKTKRLPLMPLTRLSNRKLARRLYDAGLRGAKLKEVAAEIRRGPDITAERGTGEIALGWNVAHFRKHFGRRIARFVLRFVRTFFVILDEFAYYAVPGFEKLLAESFRSARKTNATDVTATQCLQDFSPGLVLAPNQ